MAATCPRWRWSAIDESGPSSEYRPARLGLERFLRGPPGALRSAVRRDPALDEFAKLTQQTADPLAQLLRRPSRLARRAGELTLGYFKSAGLAIEQKSDGSPVTQADRQAERLIRTELALRHPGDGILGEEEDEKPSETGRRWIVDPIDGTLRLHPRRRPVLEPARPRGRGRQRHRCDQRARLGRDGLRGARAGLLLQRRACSGERPRGSGGQLPHHEQLRRMGRNRAARGEASRCRTPHLG